MSHFVSSLTDIRLLDGCLIIHEDPVVVLASSSRLLSYRGRCLRVLVLISPRHYLRLVVKWAKRGNATTGKYLGSIEAPILQYVRGYKKLWCKITVIITSYRLTCSEVRVRFKVSLYRPIHNSPVCVMRQEDQLLFGKEAIHHGEKRHVYIHAYRMK